MSKRNLSISQQEWEMIEDFLARTLPPDQIEELERQLSTDNDFAAKVATVKQVIAGIEAASFREKMDVWHSHIDAGDTGSGGGNGQSFPNRKYFLAAASFLLLVSVGLAWLFLRPDANERLFATYYQPDPGLPTLMAVSDDYLFDKAMVSYKSEDYTEALDIWLALLDERPDSDTLHFFIGNALLADGQSEAAIPYFEQTAARENSPFRKEAAWYLGLALIKAGRPAEAKAFIEASGHENKAALLEALSPHQ